ncbi:hypothetical protein SHKM778_46950 [Streptomyces sp. KM77-8]|uniref:Uncharacterized protein n=1 Tax=Streptomyces haneummycinicus TaxID=3074435 RepID=A0AAT9HL94_9ACTN
MGCCHLVGAITLCGERRFHLVQPHLQVGDAVLTVQQSVAQDVAADAGAARNVVSVGQLPLDDLDRVLRGGVGIERRPVESTYVLDGLGSDGGAPVRGEIGEHIHDHRPGR